MNLLQWGSEFIVADKEYKCFICGKPTKFIDIFAEGPLCSKECCNKFYKEIEEFEKTHPINWF